MSFASDTKKELTQVDLTKEEAKSELSALIHMLGSLSISSQQWVLDLQTENASIIRHIYSLLRELYHVHSELLVRKKMRLKKNNVYICRVRQDVTHILRDLKIMGDYHSLLHHIDQSLVATDDMKRAYLRGAFLAAGSVNNPETSSYHLEIFSLYEEHSHDLTALLNDYELNAKMLERKKGYISYMKESEKIAEFLNLIGAHQSLFKFEDVRIVRDIRNSVNRLVNCETANLNKTVNAAGRQIDNIKYIQQEVGLDALPDKLVEIAKLRIKHDDASLKELGEMLSTGPISKSGINHRLRKIDEIADKIREGSYIPPKKK